METGGADRAEPDRPQGLDRAELEVDVDADEVPETSVNAVRCTCTGQHRGLKNEDCVDILSKVLVRQGVFEG